MTRDEILEYYQKRPFRPFILHIADGRKVRVDHPEFMALSGHRAVIIARPDSAAIDILDVMLITGIEVLDPKSKRGRNGRGRGKAA